MSAEFPPLNITLQSKFSMNFNKQTGWGKLLNFIPIDIKICEKMDTKFFISQAPVTLNEGQGHPNWYQNVEHSGFYHHAKVWWK